MKTCLLACTLIETSETKSTCWLLTYSIVWLKQTIDRAFYCSDSYSLGVVDIRYFATNTKSSMTPPSSYSVTAAAEG